MNDKLMYEELYEALEQSEALYMLDRMNAIQERRDNPEGIEIARIGESLALYSRTMPWPQFNTVKMLSEKDINNLDEIIRFYEIRGRKPQFEITPGSATKRLLQELAQRGYYQSSFHCTLYISPKIFCEKPRSEITIRELNKEDAQIYAAIHCRGTGLGDDGIPYVRKNNEILMGRSGWHFYIAEWDGEPCSVGVMNIQNQIASLTFAATLPEYRGRGLQTELIKKRIDRAFQEKCSLAVSQTSYASISYRNMERADMKLGYTRATWTKD